MKTGVSVKIGTLTMLELSKVLEEVVVDQNYYLPTMFTILLHDTRSTIPGSFDYTDNMLRVTLGSSVEISFNHTKQGIPLPISNTVVKGEVTSIEPVFTGSAVYLRIRGYDRGHRLTHGKATRTYGDGNPYSPGIGDEDIVKKIASASGLKAKVDSLKLMLVKYKYVMQYNQNDWDFLWARAKRLGYQVYVDDKTLHFEPAGTSRCGLLDGPSKLTFGENLSRFEPRMVAMGQMVEAEAYGWDESQKKEVKASAMLDMTKNSTKTPANLIPPNAAIKTAFSSSAKSAVVDPNIGSTAEANLVAMAEFSRAASSYMQAYGELDEGDPFLIAGSSVTILGVGIRFAGMYYVTEAKHIFRNGQYKTTFKVTGGQPDTFRSLILGPDHDHEINRIGGVVTGIVTSNSDPEKLGRVQVKYPWLPSSGGGVLSSGWARLAVPGGGNGRGFLSIPEVNDEVLISFENGDTGSPYVIGVLYNSKDKPPQTDGNLVDLASKKVNQRVIVSRSGHSIVLDDTTGKEKITVIDKTKKNKIIIDSTKNEMTIESAGKLTVKSTGDMMLDSTGKLDIKSKGALSIASEAGMDLKANSALSVTGNQKVEMKSASSTMTLQAAGAELKGTKVDVTANTALNLNGSAMVKIQGGIVKIN